MAPDMLAGNAWPIPAQISDWSGKMTPLEQKQRNRIGQLEHQVATMTAEAKLMRIDLHGQREVMAAAIEEISSNQPRAAMATLKMALAYRKAQQTPRKKSNG